MNAEEFLAERVAFIKHFILGMTIVNAIKEDNPAEYESLLRFFEGKEFFKNAVASGIEAWISTYGPGGPLAGKGGV